MEKAIFMKQSIKRWLALFLVFCMVSSPLQSMAAVVNTGDGEGYEEVASPSDAEDIETLEQVEVISKGGFQYDPQPQSAEEVEDIILTYEEAFAKYIDKKNSIATDSDALELEAPSLPKWQYAIEEEKWIMEGWEQKELTDEESESVYWTLSAKFSMYQVGTTMLGGEEDGIDKLQVKIQDNGSVWVRRWYDTAPPVGTGGIGWQKVYYGDRGSGLVLWNEDTLLMQGGYNYEKAGGYTIETIQPSTAVGDVETVVRKWTGNGVAAGIQVVETFTLTKGANFFTQNTKIINNSGKTLSNVRLYLGADIEFRGSDSTYSDWNQATGELYGYQQMTDSIMSFKGSDATPPTHYWGAHYGTGRGEAMAGNNLGSSAQEAIQKVNPAGAERYPIDTGLYLQWGDKTDPANRIAILNGESHTIEMTQSYSDPGALQISPPGGRTAPPSSLVSYNFSLRNMIMNSSQDMTVNLRAESQNGWEVSVVPSSVDIAGGRTANVTVNVIIPEGAANGSTDQVTLIADYVGYNQGTEIRDTTRSTTLTTVDVTVPFISQVKIINLNQNTLDARVSFMNVIGTKATTVRIRNEAGMDTGIVHGPVSISSGGMISGINISSLAAGRYYLYVTAEGIDYPHNTAFFNKGDTIQAITGLTVNPTSMNMLTSETKNITPNYVPANTTERGLIWSSSNTAVATVDANGLVTAKTPGNAVITARSAVDILIYATTNVNVQNKVTFNTNGGTPVPAEQRVDLNDIVIKPANPEKTGYEFVGWYVDSNLSTEWSFATKVTNNITLYAKWKDAIYKLTYYGNENVAGTVQAPSNHLTGTNVTVAVNTGLLKVGHTFDGWNTKADGSGDNYPAGGTIVMPSKNMDLYAKWSNHDTKYTVTYHTVAVDGGVVPIDTTQYAIYAEVTVLGNTNGLFKSGHKFVGWTTEANGGGMTYAPDAKFRIPANTNLYAKWEAIDTKYNLKYETTNATAGVAPLGGSVAIDTLVEVSDSGTLYRAGHEFAGWNTAANGNGITYQSGSEFRMVRDITLYPVWRAVSTKITFGYDKNGALGGMLPINTADYPINTEIPVRDNLGTLYKMAMDFDGWNTKADGSGVDHPIRSKFQLTELTTLYAQWKSNDTMIEVSYDENEADGGEVPTVLKSHAINFDIILETNSGNLFKAGKTFIGWNTIADGRGTFYEPGATLYRLVEETILYAQWRDSGTRYTVTYDSNQASGGTVMAPLSYPNHTAITLASNSGGLYRAGYNFVGWNTSANGSGDNYTENQKIILASNLTLYAKWESNTASHTLTYDKNGANVYGDVPPITIHPANSGVIVAGNAGELYQQGRDFDGWNTMPDGTGTKYVEGNTLVLSANATLYAQWKLNASRVTLTYNRNGADAGSIIPVQATYDINERVTILGNNTTVFKAGYNFLGWTTEANGSGYVYTETDVIRVRQNTNLYAKWGENTGKYTFTYDGNGSIGGTLPITESTYLANSLITVSGNVGETYKAGHVFKGWTTNKAGTGDLYLEGKTFLLNQDTVLFAKWEPIGTMIEVLYDKNGADGGEVPIGLVSHPIDSNIVLESNGKNLYKVGQIFTGWNTKADGTGISYEAGGILYRLREKTVLYAQWKYSTISYRLIYNANQASGGVVPEQLAYPNNSTVRIAGNNGGLYRTSYNFVGWNTKADGSGDTYIENESMILFSDVELFAKWERNDASYTLTYDRNGEMVFGETPPVSGPHPANTEVIVAGNTGELYQKSQDFDGWNTEKNGTGIKYTKESILVLSANTTLYAQWKENSSKVTLTYDGNGADHGSTIPAVDSHDINERVTIQGDGTTIFKAGHNFLGWTTDAEGTGTVYKIGGLIRVRPNTTLYAKWGVNTGTYTFKYDGNGSIGGTLPVTEPTYLVNTRITVDGNSGKLYRAGHEFAGWTTNKVGTGNHYQGEDTFILNQNIVLYAKWNLVSTKCTLSYAPNEATGGNVPASVSYPIDTNVKAAGNTGNLYKAGQKFVGWTTEEGATYAAGYEFRLEKNTILTAKWEDTDETYQFAYNKNGALGGEVPANGGVYGVDTIITVGASVKELYKAGHIFVGWNTNAAGTGTNYIVDAEIRLTSNVTLFAKWTPNSTRYTVNYNGNGADGGSIPTGSIHQINSHVTVTGNPNGLYRAGKVLDGWTVESDGLGTVYKAGDVYRVENNMVFYAKWIDSNEPQPELTYDKNGGEGIVPNATKHPINSTVTVSGNPTDELYKKGMDLAGWTTDAAGKGILYKEGSQIQLKVDTTLYAQWKAHTAKYTLTYNGNEANGGSAPVAIGSLELNTQVDVAANAGTLYKTGCTFEGWSLNKDGSGSVSGRLRIRRNTTLYAVWKQDANLYSVTYQVVGENGGDVPAGEIDVPMSTRITIKENENSLYKLGHKLEGWIMAGDTTNRVYKAGETFVLTGTTVLDAKWSVDTNEYTVTYMANGTTNGSVPVQAPVQANTLITIQKGETLYRAGYRFNGWNTAANGSGFVYAENTSWHITENITLYAQWAVSATTFRVAYDKNGAIGGDVPKGGDFLIDSTIKVAGNIGDLYKDGKNFAGWNTAANGSGTVYVVGDSFRLMADTTLYAQWSENRAIYTVTYNSNFAAGIPAGDYTGTAPIEVNPFAVNSNVTILGSTDLSVIGFEFDGWNSKADGTGIVYKVGDTFRITKDTILHAKWKLSNKTFTLSYNGNGAKGAVPVPQTALANRTLTIAPKPVGLENSGSKFLGWAEAPDAVAPMIATEIKMTDNKVLFAVWEKCVVTLTVIRQGRNSAGQIVLIDTIVIPMDIGETKVFNPSSDLTMPVGWRFNVGQNRDTTFGPAPAPNPEETTEYTITVNYRPAL